MWYTFPACPEIKHVPLKSWFYCRSALGPSGALAKVAEATVLEKSKVRQGAVQPSKSGNAAASARGASGQVVIAESKCDLASSKARSGVVRPYNTANAAV